jgi:hypothetical protein
MSDVLACRTVGLPQDRVASAMWSVIQVGWVARMANRAIAEAQQAWGPAGLDLHSLPLLEIL